MGFADEDIYNMAVHYYDEDDIKIGHSLKCNVVVNHHVEATRTALHHTTTQSSP